MIRILIADDHLVVREGLRIILEAAPDLALVGEASDGAEAVRLAGELSPDVVLMDLRMPRLDGIEAIQQIKAHDTLEMAAPPKILAPRAKGGTWSTTLRLPPHAIALLVLAAE